MKKAPEPPVCPYCSVPAELLPNSAEIYRGVDHGPLWLCRPCRAWVGCHDHSGAPLGRLADPALRQAKIKAHAAFDPLWKAKIITTGCRKREARNLAYKWLSAALGIARQDCHIGMFDAETCARVVELCSPYRNAVRRAFAGANHRGSAHGQDHRDNAGSTQRLGTSDLPA